MGEDFGSNVGRRCPHCHKNLRVRDAVLLNLDSYHTAKTAQALCCGYAVFISPRTIYDVQPASTRKKEDDWGYKTGKAYKEEQ